MATTPRSKPIFAHKDRGATVVIGTGIKTDIYRNRPALSPVDRVDTEIYDSVVSKLVGENDPKRFDRDKKKDNAIDADMSYIKAISDDTALSVAEASSMIDALPDLELSKLIIVSSILSPNDMISNKLIYGCSTGMFKDVTPRLVEVIERHFNDTYKIKKYLPEMIGKAIFTDGSYPQIVLPESSIDALINNNLEITAESFNKGIVKATESLGIIGNPTNKIKSANEVKRVKTAVRPSDTKNRGTVSFESLTNNNHSPSEFDNVLGNESFMTTITDNPSALRIPRLVDRVRHQSVMSKYAAYAVSNETYSSTLRKVIAESDASKKTVGQLYPNRKVAHEKTLALTDPSMLENATVGNPVVLTPPSEAVIPVYEPGDPSHHVGYFIVLDETGNPVGASAHQDQFKSMNTFSSSTDGSISAGSGSGGSSLTAQYNNMAGITSSISNGETDNSAFNPVKSAELYGAIIENELIERLENGTYSDKLTISKATEIYRMMFTRACMSMKTQLIYVPSEFVTYHAYDYKRNGTGRSLLERTKAIGSLRMINMMAKAMASIKSSINLRKLNIVVDADDPNPLKTVEQRIHDFMIATKAEFPIGQMNFADISESLQKAGISVNVTGSERLPDTSMDVDYRTNAVAGPNEEYDNMLQRQQIMGFGIPPDAVNSATEMQFATSIVTYNFLSAKINLMRQEITCENVSDFMQKYSRYSKPIIDNLERVIEENRALIDANELLKQYHSRALALVFINHIEISLPAADLTKFDAEMEAYDKYEQGLDKVLDAFVAEDMFSAEIVGEKIAEKMTAIKPVIKNYFLRQYLTKNNIMPELFELIATGEHEATEFDLFEQFEGYMDSILPTFRKFILRMLKAGSRSNSVINVGEELIEAIDKLAGREEAEETVGDTGDGGDDTTDDGGDTGDGGDGFGDGEDGDDVDPFAEDGEEGEGDSDGDDLPDDVDGKDDGLDPLSADDFK